MTPEQIELGKRAVACKGWRWMPGMRVVGIPSRMLLENEDGCGRWIDSTPTDCLMAQGIPDLTDPATLGCLLALVREVRKCPAGSVWLHHVTVSPDPDFDVWSWYDSEQPRLIVMDGSTEAEAMVAALEAAL